LISNLIYFDLRCTVPLEERYIILRHNERRLDVGRKAISAQLDTSYSLLRHIRKQLHTRSNLKFKHHFPPCSDHCQSPGFWHKVLVWRKRLILGKTPGWKAPAQFTIPASSEVSTPTSTTSFREVTYRRYLSFLSFNYESCSPSLIVWHLSSQLTQSDSALCCWFPHEADSCGCRTLALCYSTPSEAVFSGLIYFFTFPCLPKALPS
jgi:hypothetical protein